MFVEFQCVNSTVLRAGLPQAPLDLDLNTFLFATAKAADCVGCEVSCTARDCSLIMYAAAQESWICSSLGNVGTSSGSGMGLKVQTIAQERDILEMLTQKN